MSACAQCFILELPPKIAAIWFPASEIATATSLGVFGNQLGVALGFLIPPKIIKGPRTAFIGSINGLMAKRRIKLIKEKRTLTMNGPTLRNIMKQSLKMQFKRSEVKSILFIGVSLQ